MVLIGLDIGTAGCKAVAYSQEGKALSSAYGEYGLLAKGRFVELDPEAMFSAVLSCLRSTAAHIGGHETAALAVSAMSDTFTPVGFGGKPLTNAIVSFDRRAMDEACELESLFGREEIYRMTGLPIHPMYPACKLLWMQHHHPEILDAAWKFLCCESYVLWRLGGRAAASYSMGSKSLLYDNEKKDWSDPLLKACGVKRSQLPELLESGTCAGTVSGEIAAETGLSRKTKLVCGGFDQACCALSCGVLDPGDLLDTTGTNEIIYFMAEHGQTQKLLESNMMFSPHVKPGSYASYAHILSAGGAFRWCRDILYGSRQGGLQATYDAMASGCREQPCAVFFFPFLAGMGTPEMDPKVKGCYWGLDLSTDRQAMAQSVLEGVTFEFRSNIELIQQITHQSFSQIKSVGGASKSSYWMQLKANITGLTLNIPERLEPGACGAAILAGVGCGLFSDVCEGVSVFQKSIRYRPVSPERKAEKAYDRKYSQYRELREVVKGMGARAF